MKPAKSTSELIQNHGWEKILARSFRTVNPFEQPFDVTVTESTPFPISKNSDIKMSGSFCLGYPLVNVYITMENHQFWWVGKSTISMAIFNRYHSDGPAGRISFVDS